MSAEEKPPPDVLISIEKTGPEEYRIHSDQLEHIGKKLRGFSVFNSIILPLMVSIVTIVLTTLLQYISWSNSISLQETTDIAKNAKSAYERASVAIRQGIHSAVLFVPMLQDLARSEQKSNGTKGHGASAAPLTKIAESPKAQVSLHQLVRDLNKDRFESYYKQRKSWSENYDQLLTEVAYALDRPILGHAPITPQGIKRLSSRIDDVNCSDLPVDQLKRFKLNSDSLKLQLAIIQECFKRLHQLLDHALEKTLSGNDLTRDQDKANFNRRLGILGSMANQFHCYALQRVDYYKRQKRRSILSPRSVWNWLAEHRKNAAVDHFKHTSEWCNPNNQST